MKFICKIFSEIDVIFRDKSNNGNKLMIGYSDTTVIIL